MVGLCNKADSESGSGSETRVCDAFPSDEIAGPKFAKIGQGRRMGRVNGLVTLTVTCICSMCVAHFPSPLCALCLAP